MSKRPIDRRSLLRRIGAGVGSATVVASGAAAAGDGVDAQATELSERLSQRPTLRRPVVERHTDELLATLSSESVLPSGGLDAFDFESTAPDRTGVSKFESWEGTAVTTTTVDGDRVTLLMSSVYEGDAHVRLFVQPELDRSYAIVSDPNDGTDLLVRNDGVVAGDVEADGCPRCYDSTQCTDDQCQACYNGTGLAYEETFECYPDSDCLCRCEMTGKSCECSLNCF